LCLKQKGTEQPWNAVCPLWQNKCMLEWSRSVGKATRWASESILRSETFILKGSPLSAQIKTAGKQPTEMHSSSAVGSYRISFAIWWRYIFWFDYYFQSCLFGSFGCFGVDHTISPVSLIYLLLLSWSHCSGLVSLFYLVRSIWLFWIGSFYCPDLASLISLDFVKVSFRTVHHTHTNTDLIKYAATLPNQQQRCILTGYFNNYNFSKLK
jgi:hypothetical protein